MMTCKELVEFIVDYVENELPEPQRLSFKAHLDSCTTCRDYLENYLHTIRAERAAMLCNEDSGKDMPALPEDLVNAILEARKKTD